MIYSLGHTVMDYILSVGAYPKDDESSYITSYVESYGGAAANFAYVAARLGADVSLVSLAGKDFPGSAYEKHLKQSGVRLSRFKIYKDDYTAKAFMANDSRLRQRTFFYWGASAHFPELAKALPRDGILHVAAGHPSFAGIRHPRISFDPGQDVQVYNKAAMQQTLRNTKVLMPNETEWSAIKRLAGDPFGYGVELVVVTRGAHGSEVITDSERFTVPAVKAKIVDPTGCGDSYRAGFLTMLDEGKDYEYCARFASAVAAFIGEKQGTQAGAPTRAQALRRMEK